jgi:hypothetical protein
VFVYFIGSGASFTAILLYEACRNGQALYMKPAAMGRLYTYNITFNHCEPIIFIASNK